MQKKQGKVNILEPVPICLHRKRMGKTVFELKIGVGFTDQGDST
jgi:hypothetical protein